MDALRFVSLGCADVLGGLDGAFPRPTLQYMIACVVWHLLLDSSSKVDLEISLMFLCEPLHVVCQLLHYLSIYQIEL